MTKAELEARIVVLEAEIRQWQKVVSQYRRIAADGVLRLKGEFSYAQAQDLYTKALNMEERLEGGR